MTTATPGLGIEIDQVRKSYLGTEVLHGISLSITLGSFTLLTGPSGSGKTTLLNLAAALDAPDSGRITVGEADVTALGADARARFRAGTGLVFQRAGLLGGLTARENIELGHTLTGHTVDQRWVADLAQRLDITNVLDASATKLSGGQAQRVALLRALAHRPALLFADEPTASLDAASTSDVHDLIRALAYEQGMTVLMVSHDAISAKYADAVITLVDGQVTRAKHADDLEVAQTRRRRGLFR